MHHIAGDFLVAWLLQLENIQVNNELHIYNSEIK